MDTNGGMLYYAYNGRHTVSELTDRHGDVIESYRYDAFGGITSGITAPYNTASYTGQHYDDVAGLMDMKARWYDPTAGRFLQQDTWPGTLDTPWTQNRYAYVGNNPINLWDPTGNVPEWVRSQSGNVNTYGDGIDSFYWEKWTFQSYSASYSNAWKDSETRDLRNIYEYWMQEKYETWQYNYEYTRTIYGEYDPERNVTPVIDMEEGSSTDTFSETTVLTWTNVITAAQVAAQNREVLQGYGAPPEYAIPVFRSGTRNGVPITAELLVNEEQFKLHLAPGQQKLVEQVVSNYIIDAAYHPQPVKVASLSDSGAALAEAAKLGKHFSIGVWNGVKNASSDIWSLLVNPGETALAVGEVVSVALKYHSTKNVVDLLPIAIPIGIQVLDEMTRWDQGDQYERAEQIGEYLGSGLVGIGISRGIGATLQLIKKIKAITTKAGGSNIEDTLSLIQDEVINNPDAMNTLKKIDEKFFGGTLGKFKEVEVVGPNNKLTELDEIDTNSKTIFEDKNASGLYMSNPNVPQTELQWAQKQIYNKTVNRIDTIQSATSTRSTTNGSQNVPSVSDIQSINNYVFRINADTPALRTAVQNQIDQLKIKYPSYNFSAQFGGS